ncbi:hypothetical protein Rleg4DRAFT_7056 [Rhizobium leguminosarum bv. trifolii WSM2297]|uniref:Uncharacterized protein n=1 Tax=Rhizobium leguminosarum bv. trifolii WSM2297 TaxID=754762 RepID=J0CTT3_RHILT|nr:hypothetical protein Rleg4DRAFT_4966 [Rhizobium leguminosarum bv. trifolii WSM2297]EJC85182.1 hypothetical protein Rleg4DRAFT_7056 [Rhizobium leguminosarum bv. trifolii WSM2297]
MSPQCRSRPFFRGIGGPGRLPFRGRRNLPGQTIEMPLGLSPGADCFRQWLQNADVDHGASPGLRQPMKEDPSYFQISLIDSARRSKTRECWRQRYLGLGSPPQKGQTIGEHTLQDQFSAFRCGKSSFGDRNSSRRWIDGSGGRDRKRLFGHRGDNDVRDRCFIRFYRDGDLSSGAKSVDARLSGFLLILSFDQRCLRHQKKWHVFLQCVLRRSHPQSGCGQDAAPNLRAPPIQKKALDPWGERLLYVGWQRLTRARRSKADRQSSAMAWSQAPS